MRIQVNTDNHVQASADLIRQTEEVIRKELDRYQDRVTRVEVHISDVNSSAKFSENDKRCLMEVRVNGMQPTTVTADGANVELVVKDSAGKLSRLLRTTFDKMDQTKGRVSFAGEQPC